MKWFVLLQVQPQDISDSGSNAITLVIAIIGCITGVIGLTLSFISFVSFRRKLSIVFDPKRCIIFRRLSTYKNIATKTQALIHMSVLNRSASPITITECRFYTDKYSFIPVRDYPYGTIRLPEGFNPLSVYTEYDVTDNQLSFPLTLMPYEAAIGFLFLPFSPFPEEKCQELKVHLTTTRHSNGIRLSCPLEPFRETPRDELYYPEDFE